MKGKGDWGRVGSVGDDGVWYGGGGRRKTEQCVEKRVMVKGDYREWQIWKVVRMGRVCMRDKWESCWEGI